MDRAQASAMGYKVGWRDRAAHRLCNLILHVLATREYRAYIAALYRLGRGDLERALGTDQYARAVYAWQDES